MKSVSGSGLPGLGREPTPRGGAQPLVSKRQCGCMRESAGLPFPGPGSRRVLPPPRVQVESFGGLMQAGRLTPQDQLKVPPTWGDTLRAAKSLLYPPSPSLGSLICRKTGQRIPDTASPFGRNGPRLASRDNGHYLAVATPY